MRGQTLVEFALVTPLLLLTTLGLMEGGYYAMAITSVNHGTQEGARLAILPSTANVGAVQTRVRERSQPISVLAADVCVTIPPATACGGGFGSRKRGDKVIVATAYTHVPLVGYVFPGLTFPMNARSELFVE
jgi:Flp pilus assembly protein TadG